MSAVTKGPMNQENESSVFDDADALIALAQKSFAKAAQAAVTENDARGISTHGTEGQRLVVRQPSKVHAKTTPK